MRAWFALLILVTAVGCKGAPGVKPPQTASTGLPAEATATLGGLDPQAAFADIRARVVPTINARVPAALEAKLKFAPQFDARNRVIALVPESWLMGDVQGMLRPPPEDGLGAATAIAFGAGCDGRCVSKDWAASFDKMEVRTLPVQNVELDEAIGRNGRLVVARSGTVRYVVAGLWKPDSARYFFCRATLEGAAVEAQAAFVSACRALEVRHWD